MGEIFSCCCRRRDKDFFQSETEPLLKTYKSALPHENPVFQLKDLKIKTSDFIRRRSGIPSDVYEIISMLGEGSFGRVYQVKHKLTQEIRAMKVIKLELMIEGMNEFDIYNEIKILKTLDHPNIIKIFEFFIDTKNLYIVTEFCEQGDLYGKLMRTENFSEKMVCNVMRQVLSAVSYLHSKNILHGDLKLDNILIDNSKNPQGSDFINIKLIDFGCSKILKPSQKYNQLIGTAYYIAPEVIDNNYNEKCDIWSCGIITYILLTGKAPYKTESETKIIEEIHNFNPSQLSFKNISSQAENFIKNLLIKDPNLRESAAKMLRHNWFTNYLANSFELLDKDYAKQVISNLRNFHSGVKFQQAVIAFITHNFGKKEETDKLRNIFQYFDKDGDGRISIEELEKGMIEIVGVVQAGEAEKIMDNIDLDMNRHIEYEEFLRATIDKETFLSEAYLKMAFDMFDLDKGGSISSEEIKKILGGGNALTDDVVRDIFSELNRELSEEITFDDLKILMKKVLEIKY